LTTERIRRRQHRAYASDDPPGVILYGLVIENSMVDCSVRMSDWVCCWVAFTLDQGARALLNIDTNEAAKLSK